MLNYFVFRITMCTWTYCLFYLWLHNKLLIFYDLEECPVGNYGIHCLRPSKYPSYGINCQQDCSECGQEACSSIFGCMTTGKQTQSDPIKILHMH